MCQITLLSTFCTSPSCPHTDQQPYRQTRKKQLCPPRHLLGPLSKHIDQRVIWKVINRGHCNECQPSAYPGTRFKYKNVEERPTVVECCVWYAEWLGLAGEVVRELSFSVMEEGLLEGFEDGVVVGAVVYMAAALMGREKGLGEFVEGLRLRREEVARAYAALWEVRERIVAGEMRTLGVGVELEGLPVPWEMEETAGASKKSAEDEKGGESESDAKEDVEEVIEEDVEEDVEEGVQWYEGLH